MDRYHAIFNFIEDILPMIDNFYVKYTIIILFYELKFFIYIFVLDIHHLNCFSTDYNYSKIKFSLIITFKGGVSRAGNQCKIRRC